MSEELRLSDGAIAQVAKLVQVALLTGTDVVDHLRMMRLVQIGDSLSPTPAYEDMFEQHLAKMQKEAEAYRQALLTSEDVGEA